MTMRRIFVMTALGSLLLLPGYADPLPISGSASGLFSNPSAGSSVSGNTWTYDSGSVTFAGQPFSGFTGDSLNFGSITLNSSPQSNTDQFTATLDVLLTFTSPSGAASFADGLQIIANSQGDRLKLNFGGFPGPQSFDVGGQTYTVSYDGFFDSSANMDTALSSLLLENSDTKTAYLWGTVTASPTGTLSTQSVVATPEPSSVLLLLTAAGGCVVALRRRART
jgi:hypothetical protein